jgi:hypothetical protein
MKITDIEKGRRDGRQTNEDEPEDMLSVKDPHGSKSQFQGNARLRAAERLSRSKLPDCFVHRAARMILNAPFPVEAF